MNRTQNHRESRWFWQIALTFHFGQRTKISANFQKRGPAKTNTPWTLNAKPQAKAPTPVTSLGQTPKKSSAKNGVFINPDNFSKRNNDLVSTISRIVGGKSAEFAQFKVVSNLYRNNEMDVSKFYEKCIDMVGDNVDKLLQFFPELIALLPDIAKQKVCQLGTEVGMSVINTVSVMSLILHELPKQLPFERIDLHGI